MRSGGGNDVQSDENVPLIGQVADHPPDGLRKFLQERRRYQYVVLLGELWRCFDIDDLQFDIVPAFYGRVVAHGFQIVPGTRCSLTVPGDEKSKYDFRFHVWLAFRCVAGGNVQSSGWWRPQNDSGPAGRASK